MTKTVSIAMSTYNGERFLEAQLRSIVFQSLRPTELVVGDDQSTDRTMEILEDFRGQAQFDVKITRNSKRLGYRRNFMETVSRCAGDVVFLCDQDDIWNLHKIECVLPTFDDDRVCLAYHNALVVHQDATPSCELYDDNKEFSANQPPFSDPFKFSLGFTQAFRRDLCRFDDVWPSSVDPFSDDVLAHDQWYFLTASISGKVAYVPELLVEYRQHGGNVFGASASANKRGGPSSRLAFKDIDPDGRFLAGASSRALIAKQLAGRCGSIAQQHQASQLAERYERLAEWLKNYRRAAHDPKVSRRLDALAHNVGAGAYSSADPWRFRRSALASDAIRAVFGPGSSA